MESSGGLSPRLRQNSNIAFSTALYILFVLIAELYGFFYVSANLYY